MVATAAHLADHVLPPLPVRQWVLAVPKRLRYFLHRDADLQSAALRLFLQVVESCLRAHSPGSNSAARLGAPARGPPLWHLPDAGTGDFDPHAQPALQYAFDRRLTW